MTALTIPAGALHHSAQWALRATPTRPAMPVLAGLLLDADGDELVVTGYDFETRASITVPATITDGGQLLVSGRLLAALSKTVPADTDLRITADLGGVTIAAAKTSWSLPKMPLHDYPSLPDLGEPIGAVAAGELRAALARVLPALARDDTVPMLTGVRIESEGEWLTLVATDRYRIAVDKISWQPSVPEQLDVLVPGALLDTAVRGAGDSELLSVACSHGGFGISGDTTMTTGRVLAEGFVPWRSVMPPLSDHAATVEVEPLLRAVEQALVVADREMAVTLLFNDDGVWVYAAGSGQKARAWAPVTTLHGERATFKVNPGYLRDAVSLHGTGEVTIHFGVQNKPILITSERESYRHVVMPLRMTAEEIAAA